MLTKSLIRQALSNSPLYSISFQPKPLKIAFQGDLKTAQETLTKISKDFESNFKVTRTSFHIHPKSFNPNSEEHKFLQERFNNIKSMSQKEGIRGAIGKAWTKIYLESNRLGFDLTDEQIEEIIVTTEKYFQNENQVMKIFTSCPNLINPKFTLILEEKLSLIKQYFLIDDAAAMEIFEASPFLICSSTKKLRESILTLKNTFKFTKEEIVSFMKTMGEVFVFGGETLADIYSTPKNWELSESELKELFLKHPILFFNHPSSMMLFKRRILKFLNFTAEMGQTLLKKHPNILIWSVRSLEEKALFITNRLELKLDNENMELLGFNYNKTLRPRGEILIRSKTPFNSSNIVELMKIGDEEFSQRTGISLERFEKEREKFEISEELDFRKGRLVGKIGINQKFRRMAAEYAL